MNPHNIIMLDAARRGDTRIVREMLREGANNYRQVLDIAIKNNHLGVVNLLFVKRKVSIDHIMNNAAKYANLDIIDWGLQHSDLAIDYEDIICKAAEYGHLDATLYLLEVSPQAIRHSMINRAMLCAAVNRHIDIVDAMRTRGANNFNEISYLLRTNNHNNQLNDVINLIDQYIFEDEDDLFEDDLYEDEDEDENYELLVDGIQAYKEEYNKEEICPICHSELKGHEEEGGGGYKTKCYHQFHVDCLQQWLRQGKYNCPLCREGRKNDRMYFGRSKRRSRRRSRRRFGNKCFEYQGKKVEVIRPVFEGRGRESRIYVKFKGSDRIEAVEARLVKKC